jgi:hypothetical protein
MPEIHFSAREPVERAKLSPTIGWIHDSIAHLGALLALLDRARVRLDRALIGLTIIGHPKSFTIPSWLRVTRADKTLLIAWLAAPL